MFALGSSQLNLSCSNTSLHYQNGVLVFRVSLSRHVLMHNFRNGLYSWSIMNSMRMHKPRPEVQLRYTVKFCAGDDEDIVLNVERSYVLLFQ